jgi:hybrid cluster-associated redox disulfide protein
MTTRRHSPPAAKTKKKSVANTGKGRKKAPARSDIAEMSIDAILREYPGATDVLAAYGLHCMHCGLNGLETLSEGAALHGIETPDLHALIQDIDALPRRKTTDTSLHLTRAGAEGLKSIAEKEGKSGMLLRVIHEAAGGFSLDFVASKNKGDLEFSHPEVSGLTVIASKTTLKEIGGATIDFRHGRFALDLAPPITSH